MYLYASDFICKVPISFNQSSTIYELFPAWLVKQTNDPEFFLSPTFIFIMLHILNQIDEDWPPIFYYVQRNSLNSWEDLYI